MKLSDIQIEQVINFGVFEYDSEKMSNILGFKKEEIDAQLKNTKSDFVKHYQKGRDLSDYVIDLKLFELAKTGDIKALEKLDLRKKRRTSE